VFIETESQLPIAASNKAAKFLPADELSKMGSSVLNYIKGEEDTGLAFVLIKDPENDAYKISSDISSALSPNAYLCYFDPSPLLPSVLLKNILLKLRAVFN